MDILTIRHAAQHLPAPRGARDGGDAVVRGETGDQTDQESRSAGHRAAPSLTVMDITTTTSGVTMTGSSTQGIKTVLHPVSDLATAMRDGRWLVWRLGRARRVAGAQRLHGPSEGGQTYCSKLVRSSQATPRETAKAAR
jgi:hypothetical protein